MATKSVLLTPDGLFELKKEFTGLVEVKRPEAVMRLATAREQGDLSENSEYASAKDDLSFIDGRIVELEAILAHVKMIQHKAGSAAKVVEMGSTVIVETSAGIDEYTIVGSLEADPAAGKISNESPVGKALLGAKVGDEVIVSSTVKTAFKIKEIK